MCDAFLERQNRVQKERPMKIKLCPCCIKWDSSEPFGLHQKLKQPCIYRSVLVLPSYGNWMVTLSICCFSVRQNDTGDGFYRFCAMDCLPTPCPASHIIFLFPFLHCPFLSLALKENIKLKPIFHIFLVFKPPLSFIEKKAAVTWSCLLWRWHEILAI